MLSVFIDTNVFVRVVTQGRPGCELQAYKRLKTLVAGKTVRLLVPEVVILELEQQRRTLCDDLTTGLGDLKKHVSTFGYWSEIADLRERLLRVIEKAKRAKLRRAAGLFSDIMSLLRSESVVLLDLTPEIICRAQKRLIAGNMPRADRESDQDAMIVESLAVHFASQVPSKSELLFCSANHRDFAEEHKADGRVRSFTLSALIANDLPPTKYYLDLDSLLGFDTGYEATYTASAQSQVPELDDTEPDWDAIERESRDEIEAHFASDVAPKLPEPIREQRSELVSDIRALLGACRSCSTWDDRSELKLCQWLEFVPEYAIPFTSLSNLVTIRENLRRYLQIHEEQLEPEGEPQS